METNRNILRNPFYYVTAFAASLAFLAAGVAYGKNNDAEQLHQSAAELRAQSILHRRHSNRAQEQGNLPRSFSESHSAEDARLQARQAQRYSNHTESDAEIALIAAGGFGAAAIGSLATGLALDGADRRRRRERVAMPSVAAMGPGPDPSGNGHNGHHGQPAAKESQTA